jgi:hypothetical protein
MVETNDQGRTPETESRYDSDMKVYVGKDRPVIEKNIATMIQWAKEGK